jgi:hypothetical protein
MHCKPKRIPGKTYFDTPSEYNDYIVNEQKMVMAAFDDFAASVNNGNVDSMSFYQITLCKRADMAINEMNNLADYEKDTMFRHAAWELFQTIELSCNTELEEIVHIASKDSALRDEDIERINTLSISYTAKEKEKNDALIAEQEKFAKKFNVKIE